MLELNAEEATFARPADFDLDACWAAETARFEANLRPEQAALRVSALGRERLAKLGAYATRAVEDAGPPGAGRLGRHRAADRKRRSRRALALLGIGPELEVPRAASLPRKGARAARAIAALAEDG